MVRQTVDHGPEGLPRAPRLKSPLAPGRPGPWSGKGRPNTPSAHLLRLALMIALAAAVGCQLLGRQGRSAAPGKENIPSLWPVADPQRVVTSSFGYRNDPRTGKRQFHTGIDIAAPKKSPVVAAAAGRVTYAGRARGTGFGKLVKIDHGNGYETWYAHLAHVKTGRGKKVKPGEIIGRLGKTGRATAPHVHYEVRHNGRPVDPRDFLTGSR